MWLNPSLWDCACPFTLAASERKFRSILKEMGVERQHWPQFMKTDRANATTHFFEGGGQHTAVVCIAPPGDEISSIQVASLLVHEAVHIWQHHRDLVGEKTPGTESEAYAIQAIAQRLMHEYWRQTK